MSVVTLLPITHGFLLTTNRDEHISRPDAIPPQTYTVNGHAIAFPKDAQGGGTWIAASGMQVVCLLNGAFPQDRPRLSNKPKKSRGLVVMDVFNYTDPYQFVAQYDFTSVEPFTMLIIKTSDLQSSLTELRWNGQQIWLRPLDTHKPHIWSSFTIYDAGTIALRKIWFTQFLLDNHSHYTSDDLFKFHQTAGNGDKARDYVMDRPQDGVRTISITQVAYTKQAGTMRYLDLTTQTETHLNF